MATAVRDKHGRFKTQKKSNGHGGLGVIAGSAAAGAALGVLAMLGRKAAVQAPTLLAGDWDAALRAEHQAVLKLFDSLEATEEGATAKRAMLFAQIKHALAKHAIEEENVIYPALRDAGRAEAADVLTKEHGYVKQFLYDLEKMPSSSPEWIAKVREFRADLESHIAEEENHLFPALRAVLGEDETKALTFAMNKEGFKLA